MGIIDSKSLIVVLQRSIVVLRKGKLLCKFTVEATMRT